MASDMFKGRVVDSVEIFTLEGFDDFFPLDHFSVVCELIDFCKNEDDGDFSADDPIHEEHIFIAGSASYVEEEEEHRQCGAVVQIGLDHGAPLLAYGHGDFGVAVAWEVDEGKLLIDGEEVDELCLSWRCRCFNQVFPAEEVVEEAGFAHIGTAGNGDLHHWCAIELFEVGIGRERCCGFYKLDVFKWGYFHSLLCNPYIAAIASQVFDVDAHRIFFHEGGDFL